MTQRIISLLNIREEEWRKLLIIISTSFFVGVGIFSYYTGANAIFLSEFQETALPYVFIANAILVIIAGSLYSYYAPQVALTTRLYTSSAVLATASLIIWVSYELTNAVVLAFFMMIWYRLLYVFGLIDGWELMGAVFNLHQAKRLFPLSQLGAFLGLIFGSSLGALFAALFGAPSLILMSAIFLFLYLALQLRYVPRLKPFNTDVESANNTRRVPFSDLVKDPYILLIFGMKICPVILLAMAEYLFSQQVVIAFDNQDDVASFWGIFLAVTLFINIGLVGLVSGRYINRYGMNVALTTSPVIIFVTAIAAGIYGSAQSTQDSVFFVFASALAFLMWTMPSMLANPGINILMQPLPPKTRTATRIAVEGGLASIALIIAGILILFFTTIGDDSALIVVGLMSAICIIWAIIAFFTYRNYANILTDSVSLRFMRSITQDVGEVNDLMQGLRHEQVDVVHSSLALLNYRDAETLIPYAPELLRYPDPQIQISALQILSRSPNPTLLGKIRAIAKDTTVIDTVRASAIEAWAAIAPSEVANILSNDLPNLSITLANPVLVVMAQTTEHRQVALQFIDKLANSKTIDDKKRAAELYGKLSPEQGDNGLFELLNNQQVGVIRHSILQIPSNFTTCVTYSLESLINDPKYTASIVHQFSTFGDDILDNLPEQFLTTGQIRLLGALGTTTAQQQLKPYIAPTQPSALRQIAINALLQTDYAADAITDLEPTIQVYITNITEIIQYQYLIEGNKFPLLGSALDYEFKRVRQNILALYAMYYGRTNLLGISYQLTTLQGDERGNLLEAVEILLPHEQAKNLLPLLEDTTPENRLKLLSVTPLDTDIKTIARQIIQQDGMDWAIAWTRVCALNILQTLSDKNLLEASKNHIAEQYPPQLKIKVNEFTRPSETDTDMLSTLEKFSILNRLDLFAETPDPVLAEIAQQLDEIVIEANTLFIRKDETGDKLYLVAAGKLIVHTEETPTENNIVRELDRGGVVGEFAVLDSEPRSAFVTAKTETTLLVLHQDILYELMTIYPSIIRGILKILLRKLREDTEKITNR